MNTRTQPLSRRTVLRGVGGVAIGLPLLEAMQPRVAKAATAPRRLVIFFTPNGTNDPGQFLPAQTGAGFSLSGSETAVLDPLKNDLTVLSGIDMKSAMSNGVGDLHSIGMSHMLTSVNAVRADGYTQPGGGSYFVSFGGGPSVDQVIAKQLAAPTRFESLEFGVQSTVGIGVHPFSRMCYKAPLQFVPPEDDPRQMFKRLFTNSSAAGADLANQQRKSVLDFVRDEYTRLKPRISKVDQQKVGVHLDAIRQVEQRLSAASSNTCSTPSDPSTLSAEATWHNDPHQFPVVGKTQMDLLSLALSCDQTRVASLQWSWARSTAAFPFAGVPDAHHDLSHGAASKPLSTINAWYAKQVAYLVNALKATGELDNTVVWWCSDVAVGYNHDFQNIRAFLFGKCGGYFKPGQHLKMNGASHNRLAITLMRAMGLTTNQFGTPSLPQGPLPGFA